jgi:glutathione S-transferase
MKLYYSPTSPYVRKVSMMAIETGLGDQVEQIVMAGVGPDTEVAKANPLGKVPAVVRDDGSTLYDSPVICEYLDSLHSGAKLIPPNGEDRLFVLKMQALADGALDAGVSQIMESRRPEGEQSPGWVARQQKALSQAVDEMEKCVDQLGSDLTLAHICFCATMGWIDFRKPEWDWRESCPALADWYAAFSARPSAMATEPKDPA